MSPRVPVPRPAFMPPRDPPSPKCAEPRGPAARDVLERGSCTGRATHGFPAHTINIADNLAWIVGSGDDKGYIEYISSTC